MKCGNCAREYDGEKCPFCNGADIPVVSAAKSDNERKNKKMEIILIVAAVVIVAAIIITVFVAKGKKDNNPSELTIAEESGGFLPETDGVDDSPVTFTEDVSVSFEGISGSYADDLLEHATMAATTVAVKPEVTAPAAAQTTQKPAKPQVSTTKYLEETTVMTNNPAQGSSGVMNMLTAFFAGKYYMDGTMISGGEKTPLEIAMDGADFQVFSEMDGQDIAIMSIDGDIYLMNPDTKKYTELNAAVKKMMGISDDSFSFGFSNVKFDADSPTSVSECTHNGKAAVCYKYKSETNHMEFIAVGDDIVQLILYNSQGDADTVVELDEFTAGYPSDMLTFKGYSKTNMISFLSAMM